MSNAAMTSGYESSPACILLEVYCACCSAPLVDSRSVETGMGPGCRSRHGFSKPQAEPDWTTVLAHVETARTLDPSLTLEIPTGDARVAANRLVHRIASMQEGPVVRLLCLALGALGFVKLATRIGERLGQVTVTTREDGRREFKSPFIDGLSFALRRIGGDWVKADKVWLIPAGDHAGRALMDVLRKFFPAGTIVRGTKGSVIL